MEACRSSDSGRDMSGQVTQEKGYLLPQEHLSDRMEMGSVFACAPCSKLPQANHHLHLWAAEPHVCLMEHNPQT